MSNVGQILKSKEGTSKNVILISGVVERDGSAYNSNDNDTVNFIIASVVVMFMLLITVGIVVIIRKIVKARRKAGAIMPLYKQTKKTTIKRMNPFHIAVKIMLV